MSLNVNLNKLKHENIAYYGFHFHIGSLDASARNGRTRTGRSANHCAMLIGLVDQKADAKYCEAITKTINTVVKNK